MTSSSSVSVVMTCYNEGAYIGEAVRSVLAQTRVDAIDRIVIADDGSDAETIAELRAIEQWDTRIDVIYGEGGVGLPGQRNRAVARTQGRYIAILDGDDLWAPDKLERQLPLIESSEDIGLVYAGYATFPDGAVDAAEPARLTDITGAEDLVRTYFLNDPPIIPSTILVRRSAFDAVGGFDPDIRVFEDTDFFLRLARDWRFACTPAILLYKRNRGSSITGGRKDLMAHHARVAFKAAAEDPDLLPLVPRRLSERARKLGNQRYLTDDRRSALALLALAVRLQPTNRRAWISYLAVRFAPRLAMRMAGKEASRRRRALGVS